MVLNHFPLILRYTVTILMITLLNKRVILLPPKMGSLKFGDYLKSGMQATVSQLWDLWMQSVCSQHPNYVKSLFMKFLRRQVICGQQFHSTKTKLFPHLHSVHHFLFA